MQRQIALIPGDDAQAKIMVSWKGGLLSELVKSMVTDDDPNEEAPAEIPTPDANKVVLEQIARFLNYHADDPMKEITKPIPSNNLYELVGKWDADFINEFQEHESLFRIILGANYLDIPPLLELGICKLACMIKGKEPDEVKRMFKIEDITPEEEKVVREQNAWIFDVSTLVARTAPVTVGGGGEEEEEG